jgi:hypothetical protein
VDHNQFDVLARSLGAGTSRRSLCRALTGGGLGALLGSAFGTLDGDAKKKRDKKKPCPPCMKRKRGKCKGTLPDGTACNAGTCRSGRCVAAATLDPCASCTGDQVCRGGVCSVPACGAGGPCRVFLSSTRYDGNLGGLSGADAKCQGLAEEANLPGTYKAWLSDSTSSPSSRFLPSTGPYRLINGTTIAANFTDLTDGTLLAPIDVTETGGGVGSSIGVWTHTLSNGNARGDAEGHCANWSSSAPGAVGNYGHATRLSLEWTDVSEAGCSNFFHLYCVQQR